MIAGVGGEFGKGSVGERGCVVPVVCEGDESMKAGTFAPSAKGSTEVSRQLG